ncbi:MAG: HEAT repeat domain-containing protein [Elusimicrobia bacterium]|nr:HEAT repeat domain-containing protein [Elusimicrobiota bacterium]
MSKKLVGFIIFTVFVSKLFAVAPQTTTSQTTTQPVTTQPAATPSVTTPPATTPSVTAQPAATPSVTTPPTATPSVTTQPATTPKVSTPQTTPLQSTSPQVIKTQPTQSTATPQKSGTVTKTGSTMVVSQPVAKPVDYYQMLKSTESSKRRTAVDNIGRLRDSKDVPVLIGALNDSDSGVKLAACEALGLMREQSATDKIIALLNDKEPQVRQSACIALGYIGDPKAQLPLVERVKNDPDSSVRTQAILILGNMRSQSAVDIFIPLLKDKNLDVQLLSAQALGKIGDAKSAPMIKETLNISLGAIKNETDSYRQVQYKRLILELIKASGELKDKSSEPDLEALLKNDDKSIKIAGASALGKIGNKSGLQVAKDLVNDKDETIKTQSIEALGNIGDVSAIPVLEKIYNTDLNNNIKEAAKVSLYKLGWQPPKAKPAVKPAVKKEIKK